MANVLDEFKEVHVENKVDASKKLRVGIIGTGWIADAHIASYMKQPDVEIVAGADLIPGKAAAFFKANPNMKVYLVGHTDWYGTEEYNMLLSDKRCKSVQDYMLGLGMDGSKIETVARGEQGAVVDVAKDSPEAKHDRRVDIVKMR